MTTTKWALDPTHAEVYFKVRHLVVSTVTGQFTKFNATVETEGDDLTTAKVQFTADVDSVSTNNEQRDGHLKSADFFDAANHPQIVFEGKGLEKAGIDEYKMNGTLTMRGISKPVTLKVEHGGIIQDPWGHTRTGFSIAAKINRKDWDISFGIVTEGVGLGEEVTISGSVEFIKQAEMQPA